LTGFEHRQNALAHLLVHETIYIYILIKHSKGAADWLSISSFFFLNDWLRKKKLNTNGANLTTQICLV
jgi:hypothetical protein